MPDVAVHDPQIPGVEVERIAESATDPELILHRFISRDRNTLVKVHSSHTHKYASSQLASKDLENSEKSKKIELPDSDESAFSGDENAPTLIDFEDDDPTDPRNFSAPRKHFLTTCLILLLLNSTFASSSSSGAAEAIEERFGSSTIVTILAVSLFMVGYVIGPLIWSPMSEHYGRRYVFLSSFSAYLVFTIACAVSPSMAALIVFRFFQGLCASCPVAVAGAVFADIYSDPIKRGRAVSLFCGSTVMGTLSGPFISGYISTSKLGWRWVFWITAIYASACLIMLIFAVPETFRPILMVRRAAKLRKEGHNVVAAYELEEKDFRSIVVNVLLRPLRMLFKEVIVAAICVYIAFVYGLLFMFFQAYPIIFQQDRGMSPGKGNLMLMPIGVGAVIATIAHYTYDIRIQNQKKAGRVVSLEIERLPVTVITAWFLPIGLFWLGWTSFTRIPFGVTMLGGIWFGVGFTSLFIGFLNYVTDCYKIYAASAHGIMSVTRSLVAAVFPLFAPAMYHNLGTPWATSLWAFLGLAMAPTPILFYKYGHILRARSEFCSALAQQKL
ncbi:major facilitator superfamily domain-containing protein [Lipomyces arxii]|uniref:major facilitator superfamily domain-containing protein n=1 Tax=Lipomyces arxii TaxID=56418 RepID=UPI0034CE38A4